MGSLSFTELRVPMKHFDSMPIRKSSLESNHKNAVQYVLGNISFILHIWVTKQPFKTIMNMFEHIAIFPELFYNYKTLNFGTTRWLKTGKRQAISAPIPPA